MLTEPCKNWVLAAIPDAYEVKQITPLLGGMSSLICRLELLTTSGEITVVLRAIREQDGLHEDVGVLEQEALMLKMLEEYRQFDPSAQQLSEMSKDASIYTNTQFPTIIAYDSTGQDAGLPVLLMSHLAGRVTLPLQPTNQWLNGLAGAIAPLHKLTSEIENYPYTYYMYTNNEVEHPALQWSEHPEKWEQLIAYIKRGAPKYEPCLIHRDYHPTNVPWNHKEQVIGVVDWTSGCRGPAGIDVGHCRSNLVQLYGVSVSNQFLQYYMEHNSQFHYDPYWDICCLLDMTSFGEIEVYAGWPALGYAVLTPELIMKRIDEYVTDLVQILLHNRYNRAT